MRFIETRGNDGTRPSVKTFSEAILGPMSSFGGIYVPETLPDLGTAFLRTHRDAGYRTLAMAIIGAFDVDIEPAILSKALERYTAFDDPGNPVPVVRYDDGLFVSELYHGPTRAFKDMALQPFGVILSELAVARGEQYLILAATSGDTGPATLETFKNRPNVKVACLYPVGGTSDVQRLQMVTENAPNLKVIGIRGNFDDAQNALKQLLNSDRFNQGLKQRGILLSAANSVNFGRILFQLIYHVHSYLELVRQGAIELGDRLYLNVPSGNFGNALAAYYARKMGLPIEKILISSNRNNILTSLINEGSYDMRDRALVATTSPAMDILKSSNIERILFDLYGPERTRALMEQLDQQTFYQLTPAELNQLQSIFAADFCDDAEGMQYIRQAFANGYLMDPHTATCFRTHQTRRDKDLKSIIYSTAEWTKFSPTMAEALTGNKPSTDVEALSLVSRLADARIPPSIEALFGKAVAHPLVVDKAEIEQEVLSFL